MILAASKILDELEGVELRKASRETLNYHYKQITGAVIGDCSLCLNEAIELIERWIRKQKNMTAEFKYRFKPEHKTVQVVLRIGDNKLIIDETNLTDANAERILADSRYQKLIEENPHYGKAEKKSEPKVVVIPQTPEASTSTLSEVQTEEKVLKKKGRKPKSQ